MKPETKAAAMIALVFILALFLLKNKQVVTVNTKRQVTFAPEIQSISYNLGGYDFSDLVYNGADYGTRNSVYLAKGSCKCQ